MKKFKIGDTVKVITGTDKGQVGKITKVLKKQNQITIDGVNIKKKHLKATKPDAKSKIIQFAAPIDVSNVMICDKDGITGRVSFKLENNKKVRINKKTGNLVTLIE